MKHSFSFVKLSLWVASFVKGYDVFKTLAQNSKTHTLPGPVVAAICDKII